ncbi:MAG: cofactor-independent phosphoglycerate mutase [Deltaproteobacteria bacterium]|nr:cofactor-independent phosphoglycerate mutase [Candidatus Anaeroferrophillus wilburensis]MBN2889451.1 cofactor-independent phosphoglycerate mutase [Deltaproteobacteria bacterium]
MSKKKFLVILGDGMADDPQERLGGKTPLAAAHTPHLDRLAQTAEQGLLTTIPEGFPAGSDVANLAVFGYDPARYYTGRAPLEAASMGIELGPDDVAFRCNLVNILHYQGRGFMHDFSAGHITTAEARQVIEHLNGELGSEHLQFYAGVSYRHLMVIRDCPPELAALDLTPPHDITGQEIVHHLPENPASPIQQLMLSSQIILHHLPFLRKKVEQGEVTANSIWLWGQGKKPQLDSFSTRFGCNGVVISAVDLIKGIGICAGLEAMDVPGATGYLDTNYENKVSYALKSLQNHDFVYLHVEAPDEASHEGSLEKKVQAIEDLDSRVIGPLVAGLQDSQAAFRMVVLPDHPTPIATKTHSSGPVPYLLHDSEESSLGKAASYCEETARATGKHWPRGWEFMDYLINSSCRGKS